MSQCERVRARVACPECGYPPSEALLDHTARPDLKHTAALPIDTEAQILIDDLPREPMDFNALYAFVRDTPINALVTLDREGRVSIWLVDGGWIGAKRELFEGDIGPFAG